MKATVPPQALRLATARGVPKVTRCAPGHTCSRIGIYLERRSFRLAFLGSCDPPARSSVVILVLRQQNITLCDFYMQAPALATGSTAAFPADLCTAFDPP